RLLIGLGTGVVVAGGAAAGVAKVTGLFGSGPAGRGRTSFSTADGLGAAGLAGSPSPAAKVAAAAPPTFTTPLARDLELHLLRRATFGIAPLEAVAIREMGIDAWLERQFTPDQIPDPVGDQITSLYPTTVMTTAQLRTTVKDGDYQPMMALGQS